MHPRSESSGWKSGARCRFLLFNWETVKEKENDSLYMRSQIITPYVTSPPVSGGFR